MILEIRAQPKLLQHLINWWDIDRQLFMFGDQEIEIEVVESTSLLGCPEKDNECSYSDHVLGERAQTCSL